MLDQLYVNSYDRFSLAKSSNQVLATLTFKDSASHVL